MEIELKEIIDETLSAYLIANKLISSKAHILDYSKAGEGNMNFVMRVKTSERSFILKQSRDYVNKYPQIAAPIERVAVENAFYNAIAEHELLASFSPSVLHFDPNNHLLILEDLGEGSDLSLIYKNQEQISEDEMISLVDFLLQLHGLEGLEFPSNKAMKTLNHEHIFHFPYLVENGFYLDDIQSGLQDLAMKYKTDDLLKQKIEKTGERYLKNGNTLLHGDFYPGSWLKVGGELKVIDPEFGFLGDAEFDLGVMLAHFEMSNVEPRVREKCLNHYKGERNIDEKLTQQYQGIEIMRRLIGIAQLPLTLSLTDKSILLERAKELIS